MSNLYRGPSIDASYQVSVHLAEGFSEKKIKMWKVNDDGWQTTDAKWWQKLALPLARWAKKVPLLLFSGSGIFIPFLLFSVDSSSDRGDASELEIVVSLFGTRLELSDVGDIKLELSESGEIRLELSELGMLRLEVSELGKLLSLASPALSCSVWSIPSWPGFSSEKLLMLALCVIYKNDNNNNLSKQNFSRYYYFFNIKFPQMEIQTIKYRMTTVMRVKTDIIVSITASPKGWVTILIQL